MTIGIRLNIDVHGIRHPKIGNEILHWDELQYVDYKEMVDRRGKKSEVLAFTITPPGIARLNKTYRCIGGFCSHRSLGPC